MTGILTMLSRGGGQMRFNEELNVIGTNTREERQTDWFIKTWSRQQSTRCFNDWLFLCWFLVFEPNKNKWKAILFSIFALHRDKTHCFLETGTPRGIFVFIGGHSPFPPEKQACPHGFMMSSPVLRITLTAGTFRFNRG